MKSRWIRVMALFLTGIGIAFLTNIPALAQPAFDSSVTFSKEIQNVIIFDANFKPDRAMPTLPLPTDGRVLTKTAAKSSGKRLMALTDAWVSPAGNDSNDGSAGSPFRTIQKAVDSVGSGATIYLGSGQYTGTINIEGKSGIVIDGESQAGTIIKPSSLISFGISGYETRKTAVRVVNSSDIEFSNLTFDFANVKSSAFSAILYWNSNGSINHSTLKNMNDAAGSGVTAYLRSLSETKAINISDNTFSNPGKIGVLAHGYVQVNIAGNLFEKTYAHPGYAIEIGSEASANITGNTIRDFSTPFTYMTPDGEEKSSVAGIYIESIHTKDAHPAGGAQYEKNVNIADNDISDCQYGLYIGSELVPVIIDDEVVLVCLTGNVAINCALSNNNIHNNINGAAVITDEGKSNGSRLNLASSNNTLANNTSYGYLIYTNGNGNINLAATGDKFNGNAVGGVSVDDYGTSSASIYNLNFTACDIVGTLGIINKQDTAVNAMNNWWGDIKGPALPTTENPDDYGSIVSYNVNYIPWVSSSPATAANFDGVDELDKDDTDDDNDGVGDVEEIEAGTNPFDALSFPDIIPPKGITVSGVPGDTIAVGQAVVLTVEDDYGVVAYQYDYRFGDEDYDGWSGEIPISQSLRVQSSDRGRHRYKFIGLDEAGNASDPVEFAWNVDRTGPEPEPEPSDTTPPAAIGDLNASTGTGGGEINLTWKAPGDDGMSGRASVYIIKYSTEEITSDAKFNAAAEVTGAPSPAYANTQQSMTVGGLTAGTTYYFKMKARDDKGNTSGLSNSASAQAKIPPENTAPQILTPSPAAAPSVNEGVGLEFSIVLADAEENDLTVTWKVDDNEEQSTTKDKDNYADSYTYAPDFNAAATSPHTVELVVSDGVLSVSHSWTVTVVNVNTAPDILGFTPPTEEVLQVDEGKELPPFTIVDVQDAQGDPVTCEWILDKGKEGKEKQVSTDPSSYTYKPDFVSQGRHALTFEASDGQLTSAVTWRINVADIIGGLTVGDWNFSKDSENWEVVRDLAGLSVEDGVLTTQTTNPNPAMQIAGLFIDANANKFVQIRYRLTKGNKATLVWRNENKGMGAKTFSVNPDGLFHVYNVPLSGAANWSGNIVYFRLDPVLETAGKTADIGIDYIRITDRESAAPAWEFNTEGNVEEWRMPRSLDVPAVSNGTLKTQITGENPTMNIGYVLSDRQVSIDADSYKGVQIRMKVDNGTYAGLYWSVLDGKFSNYTFSIIPDNEFHTYNIDLSGIADWKATVCYLRIDPAEDVDSGNVEIDYIRVVDSLPGPSWAPVEDTAAWLPASFPAEAFPYVQIRYRCTAGSTAQLLWQARSGRDVSAGNNLINEIKPDGLFHVYTVDLTGAGGWKDQIINLRLDPAGAAGAEVDYIRVLNRTIPAPAWEFNTTVDATGWRYIGLSGLEVSEGSLKTQIMALESENPLLLIGYREPNSYLYLDAGSYKGLQIGMRASSSSGTHAVLFWSGGEETYYHVFAVIPDGNLHTYNIDLSALPDWSGDVHLLGLAPKNFDNGDFLDIDYIRFTDTLSGPSWEFAVDDDTEGWISNAKLVITQVFNGELSAVVDEGYPILRNALVNFPAKTFPYVQIKYSSTAGSAAKLHWTGLSSDNERIKGVTELVITSDGLSKTYSLNLSEDESWMNQNQVTHLRFDPTNASIGNVDIDYIRFSNTPFAE